MKEYVSYEDFLRLDMRAGRVVRAEEFARALQLYYQMAGWDERGVPGPAKLAELGLTWLMAESEPT